MPMNRLLQFALVINRFACCAVALFIASICNEHLFAQSTGFIQPAAHAPAAKVPASRIIALRTFGQDQGSPTERLENQDATDPTLRALNFAELSYKWPLKSIADINIDIRDTNEVVPKNRVGELEFTSWTNWTLFDPPEKVFAWAAPNIK